MTRYANLKRNAEIIALLQDGVPPKQIRYRLKLSSVDLVYKVIERFHKEHSVQICPNRSVAHRRSTA